MNDSDMLALRTRQVVLLKSLLTDMLDHWFEHFYDGAPDAGACRESWGDQRVATAYDEDARDHVRYSRSVYTNQLAEIAKVEGA